MWGFQKNVSLFQITVRVRIIYAFVHYLIIFPLTSAFSLQLIFLQVYVSFLLSVLPAFLCLGTIHNMFTVSQHKNWLWCQKTVSHIVRKNRGIHAMSLVLRKAALHPKIVLPLIAQGLLYIYISPYLTLKNTEFCQKYVRKKLRIFFFIF